jgi:protein-S-isoprenylcysteine O-methyltransferase Ste14
MIVVAIIALLWYVPVIGVTTVVHVFIDCWRSYGVRSYYVFALVFGLLFTNTALALPYILKPKVPLGMVGTIVGLALLAFALAFLSWSYQTLTFRTLAWMPEVEQDDQSPHSFVARGPYRLCRHPVYSAAFLILVAVFLATGVAIVAVPLVMLAVLTVLEDRELKRRFGTSYEQYARKTPPLIWPRRRSGPRRKSQ